MQRIIKVFFLAVGLVMFSCKSTKVSSQKDIKVQPSSTEEKVVILLDKYSESISGTNVHFNMLPVKGGTFLLGSPESEAQRKADEGSQKKVVIKPFWMMETEATWDLFELFIDQEKSALVKYENDEIRSEADAVTRPSTPYLDPSFGMGRYGYPAISMTQYAALTFCKWLSQVTGKLYRLPSEAEWEYACRAGTTTAYSFGDDPAMLVDYGWYWDNSDDAYHKTALKKPNPWGFYDMHGNVAEWTIDQYQNDYYTTIKEGIVNPWRIPTALYPRSVRGGSWNDDADRLRSAARQESMRSWQKRDPQIPKSFWWNTDAPFLGFRVVRPEGDITREEIEEYFAMMLDE